MKTPLITREGYEKLKQEMDYLWRQERPEVTKKVTWAASLGDRSGERGLPVQQKSACGRSIAGSAI
ncbi:transcription elongation factor GreB [Klebsiella pneumoniae]|uniref:Transcription elongation factor GreA n=1 Tax=Klebsiella pneumoniae TaxID=573 RepID=A0A378FVV1_KLEPN|nr:transcription elongation factor GreB [Klebsiella pneumoniae]